MRLGKGVRRMVGVGMMVDGLLTAVIGRPFVSLFRFGPRGSAYRRLMTWWSGQPWWLLRASGLAEAAAGTALLYSAPFSVSELYRGLAKPYAPIDTRWRSRLYAEAHAAFDRAMARYLPPGGDVLDLGCGAGANLIRLRELALPLGTYTGVDMSEAMLTEAQRKVPADDTVHYELLNMETAPLPQGPFDLVLSTWTFAHLRDPLTVVEKAIRRLRPGGHVILLLQINTGYWWGRVVDRILDVFSVRQVPEELYFNFPGLKAVTTYRGPFGDLALIVLQRPRS